MNAKIFEEYFKTAKAFNEFILTAMDPKTHMKNLSEEEIWEFFKSFSQFILEVNRIYWGYLIEVSGPLVRGESEEVVRLTMKALEKLEDLYADYMNNSVVSAFVNTINSAYMQMLTNMQNFVTAILHSFGMVAKKDVIALAEGYVDLKGDIKRESRKILEELRLIRERLGGQNAGNVS